MTRTIEEKRIANRERNKRYRERHKERLDAEKKQWLLENPEKRKAATAKYREKVKPRQLQQRLDNYEWYIWNSLRSRAKRLQLEFNLELNDICIPAHCPWLGIPLVKRAGAGRHDDSPSVDRVNPAQGYIKGNIEIVSDKANRMKNNATPNELVVFAKEILARYADVIKYD